MNMDWIPVSERLPIIPEGKYGVHVIVASFDSVFEEINPGHGYSVYQYGYHTTTKRDGTKHRAYEGTDLEADFMEFDRDGNAYPSGDPITHWMPMPKHPEYEVKNGNM